ncbi:ATP-binding protein [Geomicrobium sp. JCM 19039]|uniref:hybrid sensor histidine kinase/response regulator n=1 Tax=Geomicrobium sp. JCM 19039 TaxID=1460636 RepID=UPI00045F1118|nr:ATP-binding protein [Geomicrobium sp. JCM 19039]GAK13144.1 signal transduction histidine kinase [Geomicrobium sp. JCM 19039]
MNTKKILAIVLIFIFALMGARLLWITSFTSSVSVEIEEGVLDLREWSRHDLKNVTLDGDWEFYPSTWYDHHQDAEETEAIYLEVPGSWNDQFDGPEGFGSYRLRILVDEELEETYSLYVPSVRSSSELYVNGIRVGHSGTLGENEDSHVADNIPYIASFLPSGEGMIEVIIYAANFSDLRDSGIPRSITFGKQRAISDELQLSTAMQQLMALMLLMNAIYATIFYFMGFRDKRLLYFSLLIISSFTLMTMVAEQKIMHMWISMSYEWGFRIVQIAMVSVAFSLLKCVEDFLPPLMKKHSKKFFYLCGGCALLMVVVPFQSVLLLQPVYYLVFLIAVLLTVVTAVSTAIKQMRHSILLFLSVIAFANHFLWMLIMMVAGIHVIYYPFDFIIAMICFVAIWFRDYNQILVRSKKQTEQLLQIDKQKDIFLANTSHELRNPLHSILNISSAVLNRERDSLTNKSIHDLELVRSVGNRMTFLLNDLLDAMTLKEKTYRLSMRSFSIQAIITGVFDMLQFMTERKPVRLNNEVPHDFPLIRADENRVIQIVFNLVHNALKYTADGNVTVKAFVKGDWAEIVVYDTGIGIDADTIDRMFQPYEIGGNEAMAEGGVGLGLSISKQLVEKHGGTLRVQSVVGEGSAFKFNLPLSKELPDSSSIKGTYADKNTDTKRHERRPLTNQSKGGRPIVLAVDDESLNLSVIETILSSDQYEIMTVSSGEQALATLDDNDVDLVVTDVMMPQMSGYELTRRIRARYTLTELPVLLLTARSQPKDIENGFLVGANDYVTKPVESLELQSRVRALTEVKRTVQERMQIEANWLQAQIQPHFLFNTLNSLVALSEIEPARMQQLLQAFSDFLKNKFKFHLIDDLVPMEEEIQSVQAYVAIEQERYGDRLQVHWELGDYQLVRLPFFSIQPLVENAIRHGVMKRPEGGEITIRVENEDHVKISVKDNGVGIDEKKMETILDDTLNNSSGIGLINTDKRLKRHYNEGLQIKSSAEGTVVTFTITKA